MVREVLIRTILIIHKIWYRSVECEDVCFLVNRIRKGRETNT